MRKLLFILAAMLLSSIGLHAGNTITYKASDKLETYKLIEGSTTFGPAITSHEFFIGQGTITCAGEITTIGRGAFVNCTGLTQIVIPSSVTTIEEDAFDNSGLTSVVIPSSVTTIEESAFRMCSSLAWVVIPSSVKKIETQVFEDCSSLISVTVNWTDAQSIVPINNYVFKNIANKKGPIGATLYVPAGTVDLYKQADVWKEFGGITAPSNEMITYTASAQLVDSYLIEGSTTFGPAITSHTFSNGKGAIICAGEITQIGYSAFAYCSGLTSIIIPNSVTKIAEAAFNMCSGLKSVSIPNSVTTIGGGAFAYCSDLASIEIPNSVTTIEELTFADCNSLTTVNIPNSVTMIGTGAFLKCSSLISVTIPASVKQIGSMAFQECSNLKEVIIPSSSSLTSIGKKAFYNSGLTSITIPKSVTTIEEDAFNACSGLTKTNYTGTVADWCKIKFADYTANPTLYSHNLFINNVEIKNLVIPQNVTTIEDNAFYSCSGFNSVTIGDSVIKIGERAFWGCSGVESLTIPASVKEIGFIAFKNCTKLNSLEFAKRERTNPINIDTYAFENTAQTSVVIPDWMKEIPKGLFYKNSQLEAIYLHTSVENINYQSFGECKNLKYIFSVSQTPPVLAEGAFEGHDKDANVIVYVPSHDAKVAYQNSDWNKYFIKFVTDIEYRIISTSDKTAEVVSAIPFEGTVSIPGTTILDGTYYNVIGIGNGTFGYNDSLTSISLSPTLQYIGNGAFNYCTKLKKVQLPEDLQTIGDKAFYHTALDSIVIPEGVQSLGKEAFSFSILKYVSLPTGLKNIPDECFYRCPLGTEIVVPEGVDTIGTRGFAYFGNLVSMDTLITLPSTLKGIKDSAFQNRNGLKEVICLAPTPPTVGVNVFTNTDTAIVYVPNRDVLRTYRDSSLWKNYKFKFDDLMAKTNKAYLYEVAGNNKEAQGIAQQYCDSIDKATTAAQVEFFTNKALALIDPYTLNDYKGRLADTLESIANTCPDSAAKPIALEIAAEYRNKIMLAIFRQDAEKIFAEGLAKINEVFELVELKKTCCNNLRISARGLGSKEIETIAEDFCKQINNAITKEEVNKIYKEGSQVIAMYTYIQCYWSGSPDDGCQTTKGYYDKVDN